MMVVFCNRDADDEEEGEDAEAEMTSGIRRMEEKDEEDDIEAAEDEMAKYHMEEYDMEGMLCVQDCMKSKSTQ